MAKKLDDQVKKVWGEFQSQQLESPKYVVQLPCCKINVELEKPEDTKIICYKCGKAHYLTWSKFKDPKMESQK